ncbi:MAG: hypothetical protein P0119_16480 [Nitrospira sp.]|nr:hypothetical protein [Nitrospira sp.]
MKKADDHRSTIACLPPNRLPTRRTDGEQAGLDAKAGAVFIYTLCEE